MTEDHGLAAIVSGCTTNVLIQPAFKPSVSAAWRRRKKRPTTCPKARGT